MALSQSVVSELLEAFRAGEGVDLIRKSVRLVMQELIETETSERIGAGSTKRSKDAPASSVSFPTNQPSSASSAPFSPTCMTSGR